MPATSDIRIISTRPVHQASAWIERIDQSGYRAVSLPALDIVPVKDDEKRNRIRSQLQKLDEFKTLIFVSQNAVSIGCDWIDEYWPQFPLGVCALGVGAKTLQALRERFDVWGVANASALPQLMNNTFQGMNSEELLASETLQDVSAAKILIFRGCGGRTKLMETLQARGAVVEHCEVYHRELPQESVQQCRSLKLNPEKDIATLFSGESLENFTTLIKNADIKDWQSLALVLPSERVGEIAKSMGYQKCEVAENATEDAMWQALKKLLP